ncbi:Interferon-induced protein 44 [Labeo rohita]|uniref:Interferon-induced protein 44 n=1 Tax=Labeo rohita TaxID=84645 RepID=A0ABQ8N1A3_LABRO|nr:Interferon-induced protein 44 [Labeo rohita]
MSSSSSAEIEECSIKLGVSVKCIYPVRNYHEECATDAKMDTLSLDALQNIANFANDYAEDQTDNQ